MAIAKAAVLAPHDIPPSADQGIASTGLAL
jgi:hypothetical protein